MIVIAVASQKGGSGKTTLSGHLAVEAEKAGAGPVALIDTDPQGSLSHWWNARAARTPQFAKVGVFELQAALNHLQHTGTRLAIIDTPPAISDSILQVIAHCDLVIVPTRPSPHDLRAVGATVDMAERLGKPLIFVVNGATPRARITGEAAVALSQHGVVAPVTVHHRVDFAASMVDGRTVGEAVPKSSSAKEVADLWVYLQDRLARMTKDTSLIPEVRPQHLSLSPLSAVDTPELPERPEPVELPPMVAEVNGASHGAAHAVMERPSAPIVERRSAHSMERPFAHFAHIVERPPAPAMERLPVPTMERPPAHTIERLSMPTVERPSAHTLERQPTPPMERPSAPADETVNGVDRRTDSDRRSGGDRRRDQVSATLFNGPERRAGVFGRRDSYEAGRK